jgi:hypothetical protein
MQWSLALDIPSVHVGPLLDEEAPDLNFTHA